MMPLDTIKIDRSLITDIATGAEDAEIVRAVIDMGHSMSRRIVAEGWKPNSRWLTCAAWAATRSKAICSAGPYPVPSC